SPALGGAFCITLGSGLNDRDLGVGRSFAEVGDLVEAQVAVDVASHAVDILRVGHVLLDGRQFAENRSDRSQFGRGQVHVGAIAQTVREVTGRGRDHGGVGSNASLVTHAQRAARHFHARTSLAVDTVVAFLGQLVSIHLGRRRQPQTSRDTALDLVQQFAGSAEVTDVGHARTDEHFVDLVAGHGGQQAGIVRVVRGAQHRLVELVQVDFDDFGVLGVLVGFHQYRVGQPGFHRLGTTLQGTGIAVAFADHPAQQGDVGLQVLSDGSFRQLDGATGSRTLGGGVGQFESLLDGQVVQTFDFENAAGEDVLLAFLLDGQQALLDGVVGDGMDQVTQGDTRLHLALEAHQNRFRHVQRHDAGGCGEGYQAGTGRERNADWEAGVRVAAGADGIRQQHAVQPAVDDAVARTQGHAATGADEIRQGVVGGDVDRLRIGGGVAEGLHHQVSGEAQASQIFQLVTGHRAGGVLGADGGHLRLAVGARTDAFYAAGLADHLLRQGEALAAVSRLLRLLEQVGGAQTQLGTRLLGQAAADDQRDTAASADFVEQHRSLQFEGGDDFVDAVLADLAGVLVDVDSVAHVDVRYVELDRQGAGVFHGVVEDRGDLAAEAEAASALVRNVGDVVTEEPQHRVGGGLAGRTGTDHVTDVGDREALGLDLFDLLQRANDALLLRHDTVAGHFQHGQGVQRDVGARPGVRGRGQVVGVGFARHLEYSQAVFLGDGRLGGEPLAI